MLISETAGPGRIAPYFVTALDAATALAKNSDDVLALIDEGELQSVTEDDGTRLVSVASLQAYHDRRVAEEGK